MTEAQTMERRFTQSYHRGLTECQIQSILSFLRAEIERVREEEKQAIINHFSGAVKDTPATSDLTRLVAAAIRLVIMAIEQNKHREGGK